MTSLEPILLWKMTERQAKVFKLCVIWIDESRRAFPDQRHIGLPGRGDPRKSLLFRTCWKLFRETESYVALSDYRLYIRAQLDVLRHIAENVEDSQIRVDPGILNGDGAFRRWKMWKRKYDLASRAQQSGKVEDQPAQIPERIAPDLRATKERLVASLGSEYSLDDVKLARDSGTLKKLVSLKRVSPYYILLSPFCRSAFSDVKIGNYFGIDFGIYKPDCTQGLLVVFRDIFANEFKRS